MKKKLMLLIIIVSLYACSQETGKKVMLNNQNHHIEKSKKILAKDKDINQLNKNGKREGLWIEDIEGYGVTETYYQNGVESGICKDYDLNGKLSSFGLYIDGQRSGYWYYFDSNGFLTMILKDFQINTQKIIEDSQNIYTPRYKCYAEIYYSNGYKQSEGILLWDDDPILDTSVEYGKWKHYDLAGQLIK